MFSVFINTNLISPWTKIKVGPDLSFKKLSLKERTKHIHKLHPYKGKFIPQLAEILLKKNFKEGDLILDPFVGSGTTLVQSNELGISSIGIDISEFNCLLSSVKTTDYNLKSLHKDSEKLIFALQSNKLPKNSKAYLKRWYMPHTARQLTMLAPEVEKIQNRNNRNLLKIVISKTAKSCLAIPHANITTRKLPVKNSYYCTKHNKICTPVESLESKFKSYLIDTLARIELRNSSRTNARITIIRGNAKTFALAQILKGKKIDGVLTSPPYVGQINYHAQHEYAFKLLNLKAHHKEEIGPLFRGRRIGAQNRYVKEMTQVLLNIKPHLKKNAPVIIITNDRFNLYETIAQNAKFKIVKKQNREVLFRSEGDQATYQESIFTLKAI